MNLKLPSLNAAINSFCQGYTEVLDILRFFVFVPWVAQRVGRHWRGLNFEPTSPFLQLFFRMSTSIITRELLLMRLGHIYQSTTLTFSIFISDHLLAFSR